MNIDLINVLLPLPLEPQSKALFVKLPNAKFSVLRDILGILIVTL